MPKLLAQPLYTAKGDLTHPALVGGVPSILAYGAAPLWQKNNGILIADPTISGALDTVDSPIGSAFNLNGSSSYLTYPAANVPTQEFTVIWGGTFGTFANFRGLVDCSSGANGWNIFESGTDTLFFSINGYGGVTSLGGWTPGQFWHGGFRWQTGGEFAWFKNGVKLSTASTGANVPGTAINPLRVFNHYAGGTSLMLGNFAYFYVIGRWLDDNTIASIHQSPWQILESDPEVVFYPASVPSSSGAGASSGIATVSGAGASINAQSGSSSGTSTVSGVGASDFAGVGSSSGTGTASGVGGADIPSVGSSSGTSTVSGVGTSSTGSFGTASGSSTVNGVGSSTVDSVGSAAGVASVSGVSASEAATVASASGSATVSGVGDSVVPGSAIGSASGLSSVSGVGASIVAAVGTADGSSVVSGKGSSSGGNVEHFAGGYVSREERAERVRKKRVELGIVEEEKLVAAAGLEQFEISNLVEKKAVLGPSQKKTEKRIIALEEERIRRNEELKRLIQLEIEREEEQIIRLLMEM